MCQGGNVRGCTGQVLTSINFKTEKPLFRKRLPGWQLLRNPGESGEQVTPKSHQFCQNPLCHILQWNILISFILQRGYFCCIIPPIIATIITKKNLRKELQYKTLQSLLGSSHSLLNYTTHNTRQRSVICRNPQVFKLLRGGAVDFQPRGIFIVFF